MVSEAHHESDPGSDQCSILNARFSSEVDVGLPNVPPMHFSIRMRIESWELNIGHFLRGTSDGSCRGLFTGVQISRNGGSCPSPSGRRWPEGPDEGAFPALTRRFAPPSPKGRGTCPKQVSK